MNKVFERLLAFTGDGVYRYTLDEGRVLLANQGLLRILDLEGHPDEVVGKRLKDLMRYVEPEGAIRARLLAHGEIHGLLYHFQTLRGDDRWVIHDAFLVDDPAAGGRVVETVVKDITALKRVEMALAEEKERLATTLESIGDGVIATDTRGRITLLNAVAAALTGWPDAEARGRPLGEVFRIVNEQTRQPAPDPVAAVLASGRAVGLANHTALIARDGTEYCIADSGAPIRGARGGVAGVVLVFRDVTEARRLEAALRREHQDLQIILDACPALIFYKDADNRMLRVNQAFAAAIGRPREAIEGQLCTVLFPDQAAEYWAADREVIAAGRPKTGIIELLQTVRGPIWVQTDKVPYHDAAGRTTGVIGFSIDITDRKQAEQALRDSQAKFATAFRAMPDPAAISALDDGRFLEINDGFTRTLGFARGEAVGRTPLELDLWAAPEVYLRMIRQVGRHGGTAGQEASLRRKSGATFSALVSAERVTIGGRPCLILVARDITDFKQAEARQAALARELRRANQELEHLIHVASHDLRSPLVNIQGFSRILERACADVLQALQAAPLPEAQRAAVAAAHEKIGRARQFILASVEKMNVLIGGLLRLSRLGRAPLTLQPVDMNALLKTVVEAMAFQTRAAGAQVVVAPLPPCRGDPALISQVFSNLLDNALKYRVPDRPLRVAVGARADGERVVYDVQDNGQGVAPEHQKHIWQLFYRLQPGGPVTGDGVGLAAVQRIVERHGGAAWMESDGKTGSRFFVALPTDDMEAG